MYDSCMNEFNMTNESCPIKMGTIFDVHFVMNVSECGTIACTY